MISDRLADAIILGSLVFLVFAYVRVSKTDGSYINLLTPSFIVAVPAYFLLQLVYVYLQGADYSAFAYIYVYGTLAVQGVAFAYAYARRRRKTVAPAANALAYRNLAAVSLVCLGLSVTFYGAVLLKYRDLIGDPRRIYDLSRNGGGVLFGISSTLAFVAIICILFSRRGWLLKGFVLAMSGIVLALHGSKQMMLSFVLVLLLFAVYVAGKKVSMRLALIAYLGVAAVVLGSFALTMDIGGGLDEGLVALTRYSDYTRNAMLVIDSGLQPQYGRLTWEANVYAFIPRALMRSKPQDFGPFYLDAEFYPQWFGQDAGMPDFGIGVQYADFGLVAVIYLAAFYFCKGWLAGIYVERLKVTRHPADFLVVAFLADIGLFSLGVGWLLPEALLLAMFVRWASRVGQKRPKSVALAAVPSSPVLSRSPV